MKSNTVSHSRTNFYGHSRKIGYLLIESGKSIKEQTLSGIRVTQNENIDTHKQILQSTFHMDFTCHIMLNRKNAARNLEDFRTPKGSLPDTSNEHALAKTKLLQAMTKFRL
jgi:hypothetical protein